MPVVGPGATPGARVEDLVGEVGGGEPRREPRRPRVHRPVTREEPRVRDEYFVIETKSSNRKGFKDFIRQLKFLISYFLFLFCSQFI